MIFDIRYYLSICWRRLPIFLPITAIGTAIAGFVALSLPAQYSSSSVLLLESAQIADSLAESTISVDANEQLQIVQQRLMTRANLLDIARKFTVFEDIKSMGADEIVRQMREATSISVRSGRNQATLVTLSFTSSEPRNAATVLNEFITIMLNESSEFRKARAEGTLEFFEQEVARLNRELDQQSARIMTFQSENTEALPSTLNYRLGRQGQLLERLALNQRERISLEDQKRRIIQIFELTGGVNRGQTVLSPSQAELQKLETDLSQALLVYSNENPRVKLLQSRVENLRARVEEDTGAAAGSANPQKTIVDLQIEELDQRIASLTEQNLETQAEIDALQKTIDRTPANEISLEALQREFDILEAQYNGSVDRLSAAATGERIEVLSKGERITIVEQPSIPDEPTSPNRKLIAAAGTAASMGLAVGIVVLFELLNNAIRRPVDLTNRFGITPLAVLPVIRTPGDRFIKGTILLVAVTVIAVGIPATLFAIHTYYLPLDLIASKVMLRLGI